MCLILPFNILFSVYGQEIFLGNMDSIVCNEIQADYLIPFASMESKISISNRTTIQKTAKIYAQIFWKEIKSNGSKPQLIRWTCIL